MYRNEWMRSWQAPPHHHHHHHCKAPGGPTYWCGPPLLLVWVPFSLLGYPLDKKKTKKRVPFFPPVFLWKDLHPRRRGFQHKPAAPRIQLTWHGCSDIVILACNRTIVWTFPWTVTNKNRKQMNDWNKQRCLGGSRDCSKWSLTKKMDQLPQQLVSKLHFKVY